MRLFRGTGHNKTGEDITIGAPAAGVIVDIIKVKDEMFAGKILGDGVAVQPSEGKFYAPCDGMLAAFYPTGHAYSIQADAGAELLVHIGIDTVKLQGRFFTAHAVQGQKVREGDLIVEADLEGIKAAGYDVTTPVVILNTEHFNKIVKTTGQADKLQTIMTLTGK